VRPVVIALIRAYQLVVSPFLPPACRYYPSCSQYAMDAVREYGVLRGSYMALTRLARCHPFHPGGVDFVPVRVRADSKGNNIRCTRSRT
jgi:putative membrane protein insertion efficiency factor